ncbi:MAG: hypothetical protein A4E68_02092 [Syntrophaceae bacterium PtaB.Bin095]|jgi:hypothetical protein|nr:MAG: hypothetical protein A4E68_02092 [Syntrophaceae bacterium PtaB.Bin095]
MKVYLLRFFEEKIGKLPKREKEAKRNFVPQDLHSAYNSASCASDMALATK